MAFGQFGETRSIIHKSYAAWPSNVQGFPNTIKRWGRMPLMGEGMGNYDRGIFLFLGGNLRRSNSGHSNLFQS